MRKKFYDNVYSLMSMNKVETHKRKQQRCLINTILHTILLYMNFNMSLNMTGKYDFEFGNSIIGI